jgi:hypothetical protein
MRHLILFLNGVHHVDKDREFGNNGQAAAWGGRFFQPSIFVPGRKYKACMARLGLRTRLRLICHRRFMFYMAAVSLQ